MRNFLKGIVVGIGGIAPGLSGSVLLVIFGLYEKTVNAIGTLFKHFKKNLAFLVPLFLGFGVGVLAFSKVIDFFLQNYEIYTRYAFFGLVIGTLPLFFREVRKNGFHWKYYIFILVAAVAGFSLFFLNRDLFPAVTDPNFLQSMLLGLAVAGSYIIPGVDSAVILSSLGLYETYVSALADLNFRILIPAAVGLGIGVLLFSFIINQLIKRFYTGTFSIIFGLFLSIIPNVLYEETGTLCVPAGTGQWVLCIALVIVGFAFSLFFGNLDKVIQRFKKPQAEEKS